jgi:hypothetical protein
MRRQLRPRAAALAVGIFVAGALGVLPGRALIASTAYAGQWMQVSCANPDKSPAPSEGWTGFASSAPGDGSNNDTNCAPNNPMFAELSTTTAAVVGTSENLQYTPPAGSTLAGGNINVSLYADGYGADASGTAVLYSPAFAYDASDVFFQCAAQITPCNGSGGTDFSGVLPLPASRGGDLYISAGCGGIAGQYCNVGGSNGAWALVQLWWADLLLTNTSAPAATGFSGSLLTPGAHGTANIAFTATDPGGPGVYRVTVEIDGNTLYSATPNTNGGDCAPVGADPTTGAQMFDTQQPCLQTETVDIPIDTTGLTDGEHELKLVVTDAAQNSSTVLDQTVTTLNRTSVSALLSTAPPNAPSAPVYAFSLPTATQTLTTGVSRLFSRSAIQLSGTLESASGVPAPGVPVALWVQPASGGTFTKLRQTTTTGSGAWTLTAPPGSSRLLRVVAGTHAKPASPENAVSVKETVTPTLSFHVATPGNGRIVFSGQLGITPLSTPRPLVFIETPGPDGWETVGAPVRVGPHGEFRYVYRSSAVTLGRSFKFRAETPATGVWKAARSPSREALVR